MSDAGRGVSTGTGSVPAVDAVSLTRLHTVVPALRARVVRLMTALHAIGLPVRVTQGRRTPEEQEQLWAQGRTAPGPVVTWTKDSKHLRGRAVDFVWKTSDGGVSYQGPWELLAMMAKELGLVAGYYWSRPDKPHVELPEAMGDEE